MTTPRSNGVIGVARRRVDGRAKVTGQTRFADDLTLPRMLHCKLLRSSVPHARIVRIDMLERLADMIAERLELALLRDHQPDMQRFRPRRRCGDCCCRITASGMKGWSAWLLP